MGCGSSNDLPQTRKIKVNPLLSIASQQQGSRRSKTKQNVGAEAETLDTTSAPLRRAPLRSLREARCRALLIGCDYRNSTDGENLFENTIAKNDVKTMIGALGSLDFNIVERRMLFDDAMDAALTPTRLNIEKQVRWLINGVREGDALFFMFSGRVNEAGSLRPSDHATAGVVTQKFLHKYLIGPLPQGVRLTVVLSCDCGKPASAPLQLNTLWTPTLDVQFIPLSQQASDDGSLAPGSTQQPSRKRRSTSSASSWHQPSSSQIDVNRTGFRNCTNKQTAGQVVMFFADQDTCAMKPQYVSQFSHPWKQNSHLGPVGSLLINALAQAVSDLSVRKSTNENRCIDVGVGALWEHMCRSLESRGYPGTPRMAFSAPVDLYAPFTMLPVKDNEFLQPAFTVVEDTTQSPASQSLASPFQRPLGSGHSNATTGSITTTIGGNPCRSLFIGIEYYGTVRQRNGNVGRNDVETMLQTVAAWGFDTTDRCVLLEENCCLDSFDCVSGAAEDHLQIFGLPTRKNIMDKLEWLVHGVKEGDSLFLFFSGAANCSNDGRTCELVPCENEYKDHDANITSRELCSILLPALRKHVKLTAIFTPRIPNPLRLPLEMHWAEGMNFCAPSGVVENTWEPTDATKKKNATLFSPTKHDISHEGTIAVITGANSSAEAVPPTKFTHSFKASNPTHPSSVLVQCLAQVIDNNTRKGRTSSLSLGQLVQRMQQNTSLRLGNRDGNQVPLQLFHSTPTHGLYAPFSVVSEHKVLRVSKVSMVLPPTSSEGDNVSQRSRDVVRRPSASLGTLSPARRDSPTQSTCSSPNVMKSPLVLDNLLCGSSQNLGGSVLEDLSAWSSPENSGVSLPPALSSGPPSLPGEVMVSFDPSTCSTAMPAALGSGATTSSFSKSINSTHSMRSTTTQGSTGDGGVPHPACKSLFIGLSYFNTPTVKPNPGGCHDILTAMEAAQQLGFDITAREVLLDDISNPQRTGHPTKAAVVQSLQSMAATAQPGDNLLIVFAGHGEHDASTEEENLVLDRTEKISQQFVYDHFINVLPEGSRCTFIIDAPHVASLCGLQWSYSPETTSWCQEASSDVQASVLCIAATNDDEDRAHVDIKHMSHPWKYNTKGGALIHGWAEQVYGHTTEIASTNKKKKKPKKRGTAPSSVEMHLSYVRMLNAIQNHVTLRGTVLNHVSVSSTVPLDMDLNFSLIGALVPPQ